MKKKKNEQVKKDQSQNDKTSLKTEKSDTHTTVGESESDRRRKIQEAKILL